ncbi:hypothetical protein ABKV19_012795 [Rosa sericea]
MENDIPESAVAKLFASAKSNGAQLGEYNALSHCVQNIPSKGQIQTTASEVQNLLVSGRKKEALQCAQAGQLWGPALVLASQLGEQMAVCQLIPGSPLRTLCLLIAGQPAEVFSADTTSEISVPGAVNTPQQPVQFGSNKMLDDWEENLAVITANRTKDDELVDSSKEMASSDGQGKASGGTSRFSRFGFGSQLLQKTVGLVLRPRPGKQAKLGETNKFYYDEKLKRWVEEGAEPPAADPALPPPPTTAVFQNGVSDYNLRSALKREGGSPTKGGPDLHTSTPPGPTSGTPPIPPSSNQFSARGRMGIRSRYVDTFNQAGGMPANLFQSPSVPSIKPAVAANAKFFIPTPALSGDQTMEAIAEHVQEDATTTKEDPSTSARNDSFHAPPSSSPMSMQRVPKHE